MGRGLEMHNDWDDEYPRRPSTGPPQRSETTESDERLSPADDLLSQGGNEPSRLLATFPPPQNTPSQGMPVAAGIGRPGRPRKSATKSQIINFKLLDLLPTMSPDEQLEVFERVILSSNPAVRPRALGLGAAILSNSRLLEYLREEDDVRRNAAVEILKLRRQRSLNLAVYLLGDQDSQVVLQAVQILSHLRDRQALDALIGVLDHKDPNVVQHAIVALGRIGDVRALPAVRKFLDAEPWLQVAAIETIGQIGSPEVIPGLEPLLREPVFTGLVTEALMKIGGTQAVSVLVDYWTERPEELRSESNLSRLAEMLEGLTTTPPDAAGLEELLEELVRSGDKDLRIQAVRCLVALRGSNRGLWMF